MKRVIFLDIDGVLNTAHSMKKPEVFVGGVGFNQLDPICVENFNKIVEVLPDVRIIISSTWRQGCVHDNTVQFLIQHLERQGVKGEIMGVTPVIPHMHRDDEVKLWLRHHIVEKYVIIDDDLAFFSEKPAELVHIYPNGWVKGIQPEHAQEVIEKLR